MTKSKTKKFSPIFVVPALNEQQTISNIINELSPVAPVLVVDDGSCDKTRTLSIEAGALVLSKSETEGYDSAITSGVSWSINKGYTHVVSIDADGQIPPKYAIHAHNILREGAVLAVGTRNKFPRVSELIFAFISRWQWGINDPLCGLKAYDLSFLDTNQNQNTLRLGWHIFDVADL